MADVTCLGILVADVVGKPVDQLPERGKLCLVDRMELHCGGCANNTGIGLAKIGIKTAVIGKVGNDGFGEFMVNSLDDFTWHRVQKWARKKHKKRTAHYVRLKYAKRASPRRWTWGGEKKRLQFFTRGAENALQL